MHPFRSYLQSYAHFSDSDWGRIESCLKRKAVKRETLLLRAGEVCKKLYFLEEGLLRFFTYRDGITISKFFTLPPYCFTSQKSFTEGIPAMENIETLEDCIIWEMSKPDAFALLEIESWSTFVRKLIQEVQFNTEQILEEIQSTTAEDRYRKLVEDNSPLLQRIPQKHLASYLGIAPQSLSRIRKKYFETNRKLT